MLLFDGYICMNNHIPKELTTKKKVSVLQRNNYGELQTKYLYAKFCVREGNGGRIGCMEGSVHGLFNHIRVLF